MNETSAQPSTRDVEYVVDDGVCLKGEAFGNSDAPAIIMVHGGGQTRHSWSRAAKQLCRDGWQPVVLDLRGHGESDWDPNKNYTLERFGKDIAFVAESFSSPPIVVGASLGGNAGMIAAGRYAPRSIRALVMIDITPRIDDRGVNKIVGFMGEHLEKGFADANEAANAIGQYMPERKGRQSNVKSLSRYLRTRPDGRLIWHWDRAFINGPKSSLMREGSLEMLEECLSAINIPLLLIRGSNSDLVSEEGVARFLELAPHAEFRDVTGAGHMIVGDRNDVFAENLQDFLSSI